VKRLPASWANGKGGLAEAERKARAFHGTRRVILAPAPGRGQGRKKERQGCRMRCKGHGEGKGAGAEQGREQLSRAEPEQQGQRPTATKRQGMKGRRRD